MHEEMTRLIDTGWTITALMLDGRYVITATHDTEHAACGIGTTLDTAWAMLTERTKVARA